ncbi:hypothetical protein ACVIGB_000446 [Bradyrhizobium sp. USDA 4341]
MGIYSPVALAALATATLIDKLTFGVLSRIADRPRENNGPSEPSAPVQSKAPNWFSASSVMRQVAAGEAQPDSQSATQTSDHVRQPDEKSVEPAPGPR